MIQLPEGYKTFNNRSKVTIHRGLRLYVKGPLESERCHTIICVQITSTEFKFIQFETNNRYWDDICTQGLSLKEWLKQINKSSRVLGYKEHSE